MIIPKTAVLSETANSAKIMNYIRQNAPKSYKAAVPKAQETVASVRAVGDIIMGDEDLYNYFAPALINRIGRVVIQSKLYHNPLEQFKLGYMELGDTVEEIFVNLLKPHAYDPQKAEQKMLERELPDIDAVFHKINFKAFYKLTISYQDLRAAFLTWSGLHDLVGRLIEQAYTSANWDEFIMFKYLLASAATKNMLYPINIPEPNKTNASEITTSLVGMSNDFQFMDGSYNAMGVPNYTDKDNQLMVINTRFSALQDVEVLAAAFNMDKAALQGHVIMVNNFSFSALEQKRLKELEEIIGTQYPMFTAQQIATLQSIPAMLVDESFFVVIDQLFELRNFENGEGLYWNYWLHTWKLFSWSPFANAVAFTTQTTNVTKVAITPATATIAKGQSSQFTATVTAGSLVPKGVTWTLSGTNPTESTVDGSGLVTVSLNETNTTLTLTAISIYDSSQQATATITVG